MARSRRIPDRIATWLGSAMGPWEVVGDVSWPRDNSRVWRIRLGATEAIVKISASAGAFGRERSALVDVLPGATGATTPALLASAPDVLTLVTSRVDGDVVRTLDPRPPAEVERVIHARAGAAVASVHRQVEHLGAEEVERVRATRGSHLLEPADRRLSGCRRVIGAEGLASVALASEVLGAAGGPCALGYIHGDFQPRNWLWSTQGGLALIDFEESQVGYTIEDFGWLFATTWSRRPDLRDAFLEGYGRSPTGSEWQVLAAFTVLGSLRHVADGVRLGIDEKISNGLNGLQVSGRALAGFSA